MPTWQGASEPRRRPLLSFLLERLQRCDAIDHILLATTDLPADDSLAVLAQSHGVRAIRGSEKDVLSRFVLAAKSSSACTFVRVTGDCPLVDPGLLEKLVDEFSKQGVDYLRTISSFVS